MEYLRGNEKQNRNEEEVGIQLGKIKVDKRNFKESIQLVFKDHSEKLSVQANDCNQNFQQTRIAKSMAKSILKSKNSTLSFISLALLSLFLYSFITLNIEEKTKVHEETDKPELYIIKHCLVIFFV